MSVQSNIDWLIERHDSPGFHPDDIVADGGIRASAVLLMDMRNALTRLSGLMCPACEGNGFVENPDARWTEVAGAPGYHTGQYETIDPEEIDCPDCDGVGFVRRKPKAPVVMEFTAVPLDEDLPF